MKLRFCDDCEKYTLKFECEKCKKKTRSAHPARFTPTDKLSEFRILVKKKHSLLPTQQSN